MKEEYKIIQIPGIRILLLLVYLAGRLAVCHADHLGGHDKRVPRQACVLVHPLLHKLHEYSRPRARGIVIECAGIRLATAATLITQFARTQGLLPRGPLVVFWQRHDALSGAANCSLVGVSVTIVILLGFLGLLLIGLGLGALGLFLGGSLESPLGAPSEIRRRTANVCGRRVNSRLL